MPSGTTHQGNPVSLHENFGYLPTISHTEATYATEDRGYVHGTAKRALDLLIAIPLLVLLAPLMGLLALTIRLGSPGSVFFQQTRLGMNGAPFQILKFRSMSVLENGPVVTQVCEGDARITAAGRWMRRLSLDELPQLINVINGEMSLIGPRPHALAHDRHYSRLIDGYDRRQSVKPGVSGWAQIHGHRGATMTTSRMRERLAYDVWYTKNANFALDIQILFRTIGEVLKQRNAY
jgi:putative colanic acid biosynthesis UDP-glucose lipid carrier transferase